LNAFNEKISVKEASTRTVASKSINVLNTNLVSLYSTNVINLLNKAVYRVLSFEVSATVRNDGEYASFVSTNVKNSRDIFKKIGDEKVDNDDDVR
jgi:hypothetical protein